MPRGTGAKCAGGIDEEYLMRYGVGKSPVKEDLLVRQIKMLAWLSASEERRARGTTEIVAPMRH